MKKGISYWAFDGGLEGKRDIEDAMQTAKKHKYQSIELAVAYSGVLTPETSQERCDEIVSAAKKIGIEISSVATGIYWETPLTDNDAKVRNKAIQATKKILAIARWLKTDAILIIPGAVDIFFRPEYPPHPYDVVQKRAIQGINKLIPTAEKYRVSLCLENVWNKFLLSPLEVRDFIDQFKSKYVKSYFDAANVLLYGYPDQWAKILGNRIKRVHIKDFKRSVGTAEGFCDLLEGDLDFKSFMKSLRAIRYNGYVTAEMIPPTPGILQRTSKAMDKILKLK